jgi:hypothetical protein
LVDPVPFRPRDETSDLFQVIELRDTVEKVADAVSVRKTVGDPAKPQLFAEVPKTEVGAVARVG